MIGNVLEWYDFAIYGYFAAAIGRQFFPHEDPVAQLIAAFGIFALGYLMRPLGGIIIGHIGDRHGRRAALTFSVTAMAIPTFLMGLLPGYGTLGLAAPLLLMTLRMIQGLSVGGEQTCSIVFLAEHAPEGRRGVMAALATCGAIGGLLLGSATGAILAALMTEQALEAWGWRVPFLMGLAIGAAGYLLRRHVLDVMPEMRPQRAPIVETVREHWRRVLALAGICAFNAVGFYIAFVYLVSWLQNADGFPPSRALDINTISMVVMLPVVIAGGLLSDRIGRKPVMLAALLIGLGGAVPLFWLLGEPSPALALLGQLGFALAIGLYGGALPALLAEAAPADVRCTAVALGFNIAFGIMGGAAPLAATWLVERTGSEMAPAYIIMAVAAISLLTLALFRETYRLPFLKTFQLANTDG